MKKISTILSDKKNLKTYIYPWSELESDLKQDGLSALTLVGYGSLINRDSVTQTVKGSTPLPVIVFGVKRIFNYIIPDNTERYGDLRDETARAALNVYVTRKKSDFINGVVFHVQLNDISALRKREVAYDLIRVPCVYWRDTHEMPFWAWILSCTVSEYEGIRKTSTGIIPNQKYYAVCRNGATDFGKEFLETWLQTTWLADGKTSMRQYESEQLKTDTDRYDE